MPDYKELYLKMMRASESAIQLLIKAQKDCEELYLADDGPLLLAFPETDNSNAAQEREQ